jgi:hypothetical protein
MSVLNREKASNSRHQKSDKCRRKLALCWSEQFYFNHLTDDQVIDNLLVVLGAVDHGMGTMFVNQAGSAGGVVEDLTDGRDR